MRTTAWLSIFGSAVSVSAIVPLPRELWERTGITQAKIESILSQLPEVPGLGSPASTCTANTTIDGTWPDPTRSSSYDISKRSAFVKRSGNQLTLLGEPFHIVGPNVYWLGLDENVIPDPSYPSKTRVLEAMGVISAMQGTALRGHTLGISFGNPLSVEPSLDVFNEDAYESIDFAILAARVYGLKILIPLVDNYNYYHGGKYQFIQWAGHPFEGVGDNITPPDVGAYFFNTSSIVDSFKRYITHHLNHVNRYTNIALKDDPTILGWESGNELSAVLWNDGPAPPAWTSEIGQLIKSLAPNHLFFDGTYGIYEGTGQVNVKVVDVFSDHFYPPNITKLESGIALAHGAGRGYFAGEFDWVGKSGDDLTTFLSRVQTSEAVGDTFWSLFGHDDQCCQYVEHDDGESFYYLRNETYKARGDILVAHAKNISGRQAPAILPAVACPQYKL